MKCRWSYADCLTESQCIAVRTYAEKLTPARATVGRDNNNVDTDIRDSGVRWLPRSAPDLDWLFDAVDRAVHSLNQQFHFVRHRFDGVDKFQYTEYGEGEFYGKHVDTFMDEDHSEHRKMSCSVLLSDPSEFEGGTLAVGGGWLAHDKLKIGQISVFPSIIEHEVWKVTKGTRRSLVGWYMGPPWI